MQERTICFHLFGKEFAFLSDAPEDEVESVIALLHHELEEGTQYKPGVTPSSTLLILACLRLAAQLVQERKAIAEAGQKRRKSIEALTDKVCGHLDKNNKDSSLSA